MIGNQIRKYRESQNMSQDELAKKMGISRPTLIKIETNRKSVDGKMLMSAANALGVDWRILAAGELIPTEVLFGKSVERINQATEKINNEAAEIEKLQQKVDESRKELKLQIIAKGLFVFFAVAIVLEIVALILHHMHFS